jgi:AbrB family looped-hinge helix DNA binding protein
MPEIYARGQVVIPKHIRQMLKLTPGRKVSFRVEGAKVVMEPVDSWLEELDRIRATTATMSHKDVMKSIERVEKKRRKEMLNVPGL